MSTTTVERAEAAGIATKPRRGLRVDNGSDMWPWWVSQPERLTGNPKPTWESHHGGDYTMGDHCARFAHKVEAPFFGWQWETERKIMATRPDGLWTHPDIYLCITRQQGKTQLIALRIIYGMFFLGEKIIYTAQRWDTVEDVYDRIVDIIDRRPSLARRLNTAEVPDGHTKSGNHGEIHLLNGASLHMGPRTKAVGRGQTRIDLAIFDEAYDIKERMVGGLTGAQSNSDNPQTIFISTAVVFDEHPDCLVYAAMRRNGQHHEPDLYAAEWSAPTGSPRDSPETWQTCQPSHGVTLRAREVARELRRAKTPTLLAIFDADYLGWGQWPPDPDEGRSEIDFEVWETLVEFNPNLVGDIVIAIERTMDRRWWCIAAGQRTMDGRVHLEIGYFRAVNIGQAATAIVECIEAFDPVAIVVDAKSRAAPIAPHMKNLGIEVTVTNTPQLAVATGGIIDAIASADVTHVGQKILDDAVQGAVTRALPRGDLVWDDVESGSILAPLKAATLAHWAVLEFAEEPKATASPVHADEYAPQDLDNVSVLDAPF